VVADLAIGGSTNAIIHLIAMARRAGVDLSIDRFDALSRTTPVLANLRPNGDKYLMEDFYNAGGMPALLKSVSDLLDLDCQTVSGNTLGENIAAAEVIDNDVILPREIPLSKTGGTFVLRGNLAPDGCVIKPTGADPKLMKHRGRALVFENCTDMKARINDPDLPVTPDSVLVLKSAGPLGAPGFPEWGMLPIPAKLLRDGVFDMVRISDGRMSGTGYGTCVLHVDPESHLGGPLALVRDGDFIELDVERRTIHLDISEDELAKRRAAWREPPAPYERGYGAMYAKHVTQAHEGCDFDFLHRGKPIPEPEIH
jgi:dihydroxy-acid dehydratase